MSTIIRASCPPSESSPSGTGAATSSQFSVRLSSSPAHALKAYDVTCFMRACPSVEMVDIHPTSVHPTTSLHDVLALGQLNHNRPAPACGTSLWRAARNAAADGATLFPNPVPGPRPTRFRASPSQIGGLRCGLTDLSRSQAPCGDLVCRARQGCQPRQHLQRQPAS